MYLYLQKSYRVTYYLEVLLVEPNGHYINEATNQHFLKSIATLNRATAVLPREYSLLAT